MMECKCKEPGWCEAYKREITGRLWEICQGINIAPEQRDQYLKLWERQAMLGREVRLPAVTKRDVRYPSTHPCGCKK
jgi:hypothetical protein